MPVFFVVGSVSSFSEFAIKTTGGWLCPAGSTPESYSYATTTADEFGNRQPSTAYELHCVDSSGNVVKTDPVFYAFLWIGIWALIGAAVGQGVQVMVGSGVSVGSAVGVLVGIAVAVSVGVGKGVSVATGVGCSATPSNCCSCCGGGAASCTAAAAIATSGAGAASTGAGTGVLVAVGSTGAAAAGALSSGQRANLRNPTPRYKKLDARIDRAIRTHKESRRDAGSPFEWWSARMTSTPPNGSTTTDFKRPHLHSASLINPIPMNIRHLLTACLLLVAGLMPAPWRGQSRTLTQRLRRQTNN